MGEAKAKREYQKKIAAEEELKKQQRLIERPRQGFYLQRNLEAIQKLGWDVKVFEAIPEKVVKIDQQLTLQGVKNPLITVFIGFSTRVLYESMKRKRKTLKAVTVIEPDLGAFKHLLMTEDISDLLLNPDFDFVLGLAGKEIVPKLFRVFTKPNLQTGMSRTVMLNSLEMILDPFQAAEKQPVYDDTIAQVQTAIQQIKLSMGCSDDQFNRFELMIKNKEPMKKAWKMNNLFGKFNDVPTIVLGGGPTLTDFIEAYKKYPELRNSLIIAPDAILKKLLDNGIKPHIVTRCERKLTNIFKGITKDLTKGIYYAAYPWTPIEFFDLFDDYFYLFRQNGVCLFTGLSHAFIDGGVSASNAAIEIAIELGARNIVTSGIDLCFVDNKSHVEGTQVEFNIENSKEKWTKIKNNLGEETTTIPVWQRCLNEYVQAIDKHRSKGKSFSVYNTSGKGAQIALMEYKPWDQTKDMFAKEFDVSILIKNNLAKLTEEEIKKFEDTLVSTAKKMEEFIDIAEKAMWLMEDAKKTADREIYKLVEIFKGQVKDPYALVKAIRAQLHNYVKLYSNVTDSIDQNFKKKLYLESLFRILIFDVMQLDVFNYENNCNATINGTEFLDERHEAYYMFTKELLIKTIIYLKAFKILFSEGSVDFNRI